MQHRVEVTAAAGLEASWLSRLAQSLGGGSNSSKERLLSKAAPHKHTAVVSSCTDHVLVVVRKADVGDMSRVPEIPLVLGKFFCAWEIKQFHQPKVVSCDYI